MQAHRKIVKDGTGNTAQFGPIAVRVGEAEHDVRVGERSDGGSGCGVEGSGESGTDRVRSSVESRDDVGGEERSALRSELIARCVGRGNGVGKRERRRRRC
jgi:hypothetical protein